MSREAGFHREKNRMMAEVTGFAPESSERSCTTNPKAGPGIRRCKILLVHSRHIRLKGES